MKAGVTGGLLAAALWAAPATAQDAPLPTPPGFEPGLGLQLGGIEFYTRLEAGIGWTSNGRNDTTEESDHLRTFQGEVSAQSTWKRHEVTASVSHVDTRTIDIDEDSWATSGNVTGRLDLWEDWSVNAGLLHEEDIVEKHHPAQFIGNQNGRTVTEGFQLGVKREDADSLVSLQGTHQDVENETEIDTTNIQLIEDSDRAESDLTLQAGPKYSWGQAYVKAGLRWIDYKGTATPGQVDRNSHGYNAGLGAAFQLGSVSGLVEVIGFHQDYETDTIGEVNGVTATAELTWEVQKDFALGGLLSRSFDEQATAGSAGLYTTMAAVGAIYQPLDDVYVKLGPSYRYFEQEGLNTSAQSVAIAGTAAWQVHDRIELLLKADYSHQTANDAALAALEYDDATVTLSTVITF